MIILTQEILDAVGVCSDGQRVAEEFNCIGIDLSIGIQIMEDNNTGYAAWARSLYSNRIALKLSNHYEYIQYLVLDPVNNQLIPTPNISGIRSIKEKIYTDNPDIDKTSVLVYEEIKCLEGKTHRFLL